MKSQNVLVVVSKLVVVAMTVLAMAGAPGVQAAALPNQITVHNQDLTSGVIIVDSVTAAQDGWIVVYKNPDFREGDIVGYAPVYKGTHTGVKVTIDTAKVGDLPTLWIELHADNGVPGLFEWGLRSLPYDDVPVAQNGQLVIAAFATTAAAPSQESAASTTGGRAAVPPAVSANQIVISNQDVSNGIIVASSVSVAQDGWLVIYKNPNLTPGEIVGYAWVHAGANSGVKVTINTARIGDQPTLWAELHADNGVPGLFEWGLRGLSYDDAPLSQNGLPVVVAFGTSGM
jgi:hypothetical protein